MTIQEEIKQLKKEKDAVILAHYYVNDEIQDMADYIGDSYYLAKVATGLTEKVICFCGVSFMGESAKILNPDKIVVSPDPEADCPMAHMATAEKIKMVKEKYDDLAVVCYINSTTELKEYSDVCVTSANAMKIVKALPQKNIYFIPDENLGRYIATKVPEKNFIFNDGFCPIHKKITRQMAEDAKKAHPNAQLLVHPECTLDVLELADYIGSTSGIIDYATKTDCEEFLIATELGVLYKLNAQNPDKKFYEVSKEQICADMKKITLEKLRDCLKNLSGQVEVSEEVRKSANLPLEKMLELAK